jgi:hypothetical protein
MILVLHGEVDVIGNGSASVLDVAEVDAGRFSGTEAASGFVDVQAGDVDAPHGGNTNADATDVTDEPTVNVDGVGPAEVAAEFDFVGHLLSLLE